MKIRPIWTTIQSMSEDGPPARTLSEPGDAMPLWDEDPLPPAMAGEPPRLGTAAPPEGLSYEAYMALVDRWYTPLLHYLRQLCGERQQAEDLLQDTFLRAWERRSAFRDPQAARGWLFTVAGNLHRQQYRRDPERASGHLVELSEAVAAAPDAPPLSDTLRRALAELSAEDRQVILLVSVHGFTLPEAAALLNLGASAATKRWQRARNRLADGISRQNGALRGDSRQAGVAGRKGDSR